MTQEKFGGKRDDARERIREYIGILDVEISKYDEISEVTSQAGIQLIAMAMSAAYTNVVHSLREILDELI